MFRKVSLLVGVLGLMMAACASESAGDEGTTTGAASGSTTGRLEEELQKWDARQNQCAGFDYFPTGGMRSFWCHRPASGTIAALGKLAGVPIFKSGPHPADDLVLTATNDFGHYNPAFVQWLGAHGVSPRGSAVQRATQASYDSYLRPLAEVFYTTYLKVKSQPACFEREKAAYAAAIAEGRGGEFLEREYFFMNSEFCSHDGGDMNYFFEHGVDGKLDGNVVKTTIGFWMRRSMDGTIDEFGAGLGKLIAAYEPELLAAKAD